MDCVTLDRAVDITDPEKREQVTLLMDQYLDRFHSAGFVHGDFRPGNILVVYNPDDSVQSIKVIDFDSCGLQGRCHYPCSLNMRDINWAEDVDGGRLILPEHDRHFVDLYRNNCSTWRTGFY
jgi:serine/threonine protein kinase